MLYGPFDGTGPGSSITESFWVQMGRLWLSTGVVKGEANELAVFADSTGMQVKVPTGTAWVEGQLCLNDALATLAIATADLSNPRIDAVVLRKDNLAKSFTLLVLTGAPSATPVAPTLTQNADQWDLPLAQVYVGAGVSTIAAGNVTDTRLLVRNVDASAAQTITNKDLTATALHVTGNSVLDGTVSGAGSLGGKFASRFYAKAGAWNAGVTAPTFGSNTTGNEFDYWDFADGVSQYVVQEFRLSATFAGGVIRVKPLWWAPSGAGAVVWRLDSVVMALGSSPTAAYATGTPVTATAAATLTETEIDTATLAAADAGKLVNLRLMRVGADAGDTLAAVARLRGAMVEMGS